jgi:hypothetical protein
MSNNYGPKIVTDGLVLCLDAADRNSYPGTGTQLYDLSGNGNHGYFYNGATFDGVHGGSILYDGVNDFTALTTISIGTSTTVDITYKLLNPSHPWGPLWRYIDWKERIFDDRIVLINANGTYYTLYGPDDSTNNINICYSYSGTNAKSYKNGSLVTNLTMNNTMNTGSYGYRIATQGGGSTITYINMHLYSVRFYNRQLTDYEVQQNYQATKGRFGL